MLEKPLGMDIPESRDLVDRLAAAGVPAAVNFTQAAGPALADPTEAARSRALGELLGAHLTAPQGQGGNGGSATRAQRSIATQSPCGSRLLPSDPGS